METNPVFEEWPKIQRYRKVRALVTEKTEALAVKGDAQGVVDAPQPVVT